MNNTKQSNVHMIVFTGLCMALCVVLPLAFHFIPNAGTVLCPMHIPVLICGLVCGWQFGLLCGIMGPVLSFLLTGMPSAAALPSMIVELAIYGTAAALMMKLIHTKSAYADLYISLISSMVIGRIVAGIVKALFFARGEITIATWATAYFVTCLPGIAVQLVFIPSVIVALQRARLLPPRYEEKKNSDEEFEED